MATGFDTSRQPIGLNAVLTHLQNPEESYIEVEHGRLHCKAMPPERPPLVYQSCEIRCNNETTINVRCLREPPGARSVENQAVQIEQIVKEVFARPGEAHQDDQEASLSIEILQTGIEVLDGTEELPTGLPPTNRRPGAPKDPIRRFNTKMDKVASKLRGTAAKVKGIFTPWAAFAIRSARPQTPPDSGISVAETVDKARVMRELSSLVEALEGNTRALGECVAESAGYIVELRALLTREEEGTLETITTTLDGIRETVGDIKGRNQRLPGRVEQLQGQRRELIAALQGHRNEIDTLMDETVLEPVEAATIERAQRNPEEIALFRDDNVALAEVFSQVQTKMARLEEGRARLAVEEEARIAEEARLAAIEERTLHDLQAAVEAPREHIKFPVLAMNAKTGKWEIRGKKILEKTVFIETRDNGNGIYISEVDLRNHPDIRTTIDRLDVRNHPQRPPEGATELERLRWNVANSIRVLSYASKK